VLALTAMATVAAAQHPEPPTPPPTFADRTEVTVGNVDVVAIGEDGLPVGGLTADDFILYVDGRETPITNFARLAGQRAPQTAATQVEPAPERAPAPAPEPQVIVVYVDNANTLLFDRNHLLRRLAAFVRANLRPPAHAVVAVFDTHLRFVTPLSPEPEIVATALEALQEDARNVGANQNMLISSLRQILTARDDAMAVGPPGGPTPYQPMQPLLTMVRGNVQHLEDETRRSVDALKLLVRTLSGLRGRKSVIYASGGLPASPGLELTLALGEDSSGPLLFAPTRPFLDLVQWAAAAEVTFYAVDARGLIAPGGGAAEYRQRMPHGIDSTYVHNYQDAVAAVADLTGGVAVAGTNDLGAGLDRIYAAMTSRYSLGFPLQSSGEDRAHSIQVGLRSERSVRLRYRRTLVERSPATRVADRTTAAAAFGLSENPLGIRLQCGEPQPLEARGRFRVPITFLVPGPRLLLERAEGTLRGSVSVFAIAVGDEGKRTPLATDHFSVAIPVEKVDTLATLGLETAIEIDEGSWRVAVGLLDDLGLGTGYTMFDLTTPAWRR